MKVLLINASPHTDGCTNAALTEIATTLQKDGIECYRVFVRKCSAQCVQHHLSQSV